MILNSFSAQNVHGYLNYDITFDKKLSFLIGINGTGKTSVLKLILGLISPSYNYLSSIHFECATLKCVDDVQGNIEIVAKKSNNQIINLHILLENKSHDSNCNFDASKISSSEFRDSEEKDTFLKSFLEDFNNQPTVKIIKSLSTPLFLGLDRRIYEGQQIDRMRHSFFFRKKYQQIPQGELLNNSLIDIQEVIYEYLRERSAQQQKINQEFKNKVLSKSFEFLEPNRLDTQFTSITLKQKKDNALNAFDNLGIDGITEQINNYFAKFENLLIKVNSFSSKKTMDATQIGIYSTLLHNQSQIQRIDELISLNDIYQTEIKELYEPIHQFEKIVNSFFSESRKRIEIDQKGDIIVIFPNEKRTKIFDLSSGEKQIITMIGHLIFFKNENTNSDIFIIDEPELSLHLAWQEIFVKSILEASSNTQFILATHSPSIIGSNAEELCHDLGKLNLGDEYATV